MAKINEISLSPKLAREIQRLLVTAAATTKVSVTDTGAADVLTTIDADTGAIKTAVELLDNAISGSEMQVDVVSQPADTFVAEDGALGKGVLLQGDDGTDRHNVAVDTSGRLQVNSLEHDVSQLALLQNILRQLRVMNTHLEAITGESILITQ